MCRRLPLPLKRGKTGKCGGGVPFHRRRRLLSFKAQRPLSPLSKSKSKPMLVCELNASTSGPNWPLAAPNVHQSLPSRAYLVKKGRRKGISSDQFVGIGGKNRKREKRSDKRLSYVPCCTSPLAPLLTVPPPPPPPSRLPKSPKEKEEDEGSGRMRSAIKAFSSFSFTAAPRGHSSAKGHERERGERSGGGGVGQIHKGRKVKAVEEEEEEEEEELLPSRKESWWGRRRRKEKEEGSSRLTASHQSLSYLHKSKCHKGRKIIPPFSSPSPPSSSSRFLLFLSPPSPVLFLLHPFLFLLPLHASQS